MPWMLGSGCHAWLAAHGHELTRQGGAALQFWLAGNYTLVDHSIFRIEKGASEWTLHS